MFMRDAPAIATSAGDIQCSLFVPVKVYAAAPWSKFRSSIK
jgi:hypothetical protein